MSRAFLTPIGAVALSSNPADSINGGVYYNTSDNTLRYYNGTSWVSLETVGSSQPLDADLTAIAGLSGTSGLLRKTAANTWSLDTNTYLTGNQTITLSGDVSGSGTTSISVTIADDSHNHIVSNVDGLQTALDTKSSLASPTFTGTVTVPTLSLTTADTATTATHYIVETGTDGVLRPKTLANTRTEIVTTAAVNSASATTVGIVTSGTWQGSEISTTYTAAKVISVNGSTGAVTGLATTSGNLSQFAATTSSQLSGVISDETGSGALVFATSPTFTSPRISSNSSINDSNGNELINFPTAVTSAINELSISNSATGQPVSITTTGSDTNIGLNITTKGTGSITIDTGSGAGEINLKPGSSNIRLWDDNSSHYYQFVTGDRTSNYNITLPAGNVTLQAGTMARTTEATLGSLVNIASAATAITLQMGYGATTSGVTKTINIGPNGVSGSITNINIGSSVSGANTNIILNGIPTAPTATAGTNTTRLATTEFVQTAVASAGETISPLFLMGG